MGHGRRVVTFEMGLTVCLLLGLAFGAAAETPSPMLVSEGESTAQVVKSEPLISQSALQKLDEAIKRIDLQAHIKLDFETENLGGGAYWQRKVEASYRQGYTTLIDDFGMAGFLTVGDRAQQTDTKQSFFGVTSDGLVRMLFARQFEGNGLADYGKVIVKAPYTPFGYLPMNSDKAMNKMVVNDVIQFQAMFNLTVSAAQVSLLAPQVPLSVGASYMMSGEFQVHLYRLNNDKFRLKVIGVRGRQVGLGVRLGFSTDDDLQITRVAFLDRTLRSRLSFVPLNVAVTFPRSNLFMLDYVLDMSKPEVKEAFDQFMDDMWHVKTLKYLNPFNSREEMHQMVLADATPFQNLYEKEMDKNIDERIVDRMFRGADDILGGSRLQIEFGQRDIGAVKWNQSFSENYISARDRFNNQRYFYMPIYTILSGYRFLFGFVTEETQRSASILFETDENKKITSFGELSFYLEHKDKKMSTNEIRRYKNLIRKRIPQELYNRIDWRDWADEHPRASARITSLLVFRPNSLAYAEGLGAGQLRERFVSYAKSFNEIDALPDISLQGNSDPTMMSNSRRFEDRFLNDLNYIAYSLDIVLNPELDGYRRAEVFAAMRTNPLWAEIGGGFLVHLLETEAKRKNGEKGIDDLLAHIYYETTWEAKDADTVHEIFGPCNNRRLYKAIMYIYSVLTNRGVEMRLIDNDDVPGIPDKAKVLECED